ncbi:MAG: hypothetical protein MUF81_01075 [Verrucomicrobia bacterium]|nr:hypothetical protein [Verrucomicrobiota bacterium]
MARFQAARALSCQGCNCKAIAGQLSRLGSPYQPAVQWLAKAFVDVRRLSETATVFVEPWVILKMTISKYTVEWKKDGRPVARVVLVETTRELWTLRVEDPNISSASRWKFRILITLSQTNIPALPKD